MHQLASQIVILVFPCTPKEQIIDFSPTLKTRPRRNETKEKK